MTNALFLVAAILLGEARGEGPKGITAVADVIRNRCIARRMTPVEVVTQRLQFSSLRPGLVADMRREAQWPVAVLLARQLHTDPTRIPSLTRGATHFESSIGEPPYWALGRKPTVKIGNHSFYKL